MGFWDWLIGPKKTPQRKPPKRRKKKGIPATGGEPFAPEAFPFTAEVRLHHPDYERLTTGWWQVTADSATMWNDKVREMEQSFRRHFGNYVTKKGEVLPRWSDRTWEELRPQLRVRRRRA